MGGGTLAQSCALVLGVVLVSAGVLGFFVSSGASFGAGEGLPSGSLLGLEINGWHNLVHLASGAVALATVGSPGSARLFALAFGAVYAVIFLLGLVTDPLLGIIPVNGADHGLHLAIAVVGIVVGLVTSSEPAATAA